MEAITGFDELYNLAVGEIILSKKKGGLADDKVLMPDEGVAVVRIDNGRFTRSSLVGSACSFVREGERAVEIALPIHGVHTLRVVTEREFKMYDRELYILDREEYFTWINKHSKHQNKQETS